MALSAYLANKLLDHAIGKAAFAMPAAVYLAAFTAAPSSAGGGTEAAWTGYARAPIVPASWAASAAGISANAADVIFGGSGGGGAQTVTHIGTFDALAGGNLLEFYALAAPVIVNPGQRLVIPAGEFVRRIALAAAGVGGRTAGLDFSNSNNSGLVAAFAF